jgi:hypothetical protein
MSQAPLFDVDPQARRAFDWYATPRHQTRALLAREAVFGPVLEPCVGDGAIVSVLQKNVSPQLQVITNDIDPGWMADSHLDITRPETWDQFGPWRECVTNFPFNVADQVVPLAHERLQPGGLLAVILRLSWLEPTGEEGDDFIRGNWLDKHPPHRLIVLPRHDYRGNGKTDSVTSAWFCWYGSSGARGISVVSKAERDRYIAEERLR